jgi:hypothetical protein
MSRKKESSMFGEAESSRMACQPVVLRKNLSRDGFQPVRCEKAAEARRIAAADSVPAISAEYPLAMSRALQFLVLTVAGWVNRHQEDLIDYLREENRVLREHLGPRPLRLTDAQRRRLAVRGKQRGRRALMQVAGVVTPDTILRCGTEG